VAERTDLRMGTRFQAACGAEATDDAGHMHGELWEVVGILEPTGTAFDRMIFVPLVSTLAIADHAEVIQRIFELQQAAGVAPEPHQHGHAHHEGPCSAADGDHAGCPHGHFYHMHGDMIHMELPEEAWVISAVFLRTIGGGHSQELIFQINNLPHARAMNPAWEMRQFFEGFLRGSQYLLLAISALVTVVAAVGILVSIYNSVSARLREIAIIRALGATRARVLSIICLEAGLVGLMGAVLGLILGHALVALGNVFLVRHLGERLDYARIGAEELAYVALVVVIAVLAGMVPALKAYRTPVATNLTP